MTGLDGGSWLVRLHVLLLEGTEKGGGLRRGGGGGRKKGGDDQGGWLVSSVGFSWFVLVWLEGGECLIFYGCYIVFSFHLFLLLDLTNS